MSDNHCLQSETTTQAFNGAEVLVMLGASLQRSNLSTSERDLGLRTVEYVAMACRQAGYPKTDIMETMLIRGATKERLLAICGDAVRAIGNVNLLAAIWTASGEALPEQ